VGGLHLLTSPPRLHADPGRRHARRHRAELEETADGWKITSFEDEVVQVLNWKGEDAEETRGMYSPG